MRLRVNENLNQLAMLARKQRVKMVSLTDAHVSALDMLCTDGNHSAYLRRLISQAFFAEIETAIKEIDDQVKISALTQQQADAMKDEINKVSEALRAAEATAREEEEHAAKLRKMVLKDGLLHE